MPTKILCCGPPLHWNDAMQHTLVQNGCMLIILGPVLMNLVQTYCISSTSLTLYVYVTIILWSLCTVSIFISMCCRLPAWCWGHWLHLLHLQWASSELWVVWSWLQVTLSRKCSSFWSGWMPSLCHSLPLRAVSVSRRYRGCQWYLLDNLVHLSRVYKTYHCWNRTLFTKDRSSVQPYVRYFQMHPGGSSLQLQHSQWRSICS